MTIAKLMTLGAAFLGLAIICGCGHSDTAKQDARQSQTANVQTEWNDYGNNLSPFTKVRFDNEQVMVTYNGAECELAAINGVSTPELLQFCHQQYKDRWQKRFTEDLEPVLHDMGHPVSADNTVSLTLVDPATGQTTDIASAIMTAENRAAVLGAEKTISSN
jgi:hypothetical protein